MADYEIDQDELETDAGSFGEGDVFTREQLRRRVSPLPLPGGVAGERPVTAAELVDGRHVPVPDPYSAVEAE